MVVDREGVRDLLMESANALLERISEAFRTKSRGGTDEAGDRWAPLSPVTLAIRARRGDVRSPSRGRGKKGKVKYDDVTPARRRLLNIAKGRSALHDKYGRNAPRTDILVDSGALLDSLTPNSGSPYQVIRAGHGRIELGTDRPGAMDHHTGVPERNLPQRRLWPAPGSWPQSWWRDVSDPIVRAIVQTVIERINGA